MLSSQILGAKVTLVAKPVAVKNLNIKNPVDIITRRRRDGRNIYACEQQRYRKIKSPLDRLFENRKGGDVKG